MGKTKIKVSLFIGDTIKDRSHLTRLYLDLVLRHLIDSGIQWGDSLSSATTNPKVLFKSCVLIIRDNI